METTYYAYPTHEFFITLGRLWFERLDEEIWKFAQGLSEWLYHLDAHPTPNWRQGLDRFLAQQRAEGREPTPESRAELEAFLEDWARNAFPTETGLQPVTADEQSNSATPAVRQMSGRTEQSKSPPQRGRFAPRPKVRTMSEDEALFYKKLADAKRHLDEIEAVLQPLGRKLDVAKLGEPTEIEDELDQIETLIARHNDAMEGAREAWLQGDLGRNTYDRLMLAPSPASVGLPLFVNQDQAERAKEQWKKIGKRLNQRIAFLDNVILSMQVMEAAGQVASFAVGGVLLFNAVQVGGKIVLVKTAAKVAAGYAVSRVAGEAVHAGLRAAGVSEETIEGVQTAVTIITWLLILRKINKSLPTPSAPATKLPPQPGPADVSLPKTKTAGGLGKNPYKNQSGDPEVAASKARSYPYGPGPARTLRRKTYPQIEGRVDSPRSPNHKFLQRALAEELQASGDFTRVTMRIKLSKVSGVSHRPDIEPDNVGL